MGKKQRGKQQSKGYHKKHMKNIVDQDKNVIVPLTPEEYANLINSNDELQQRIYDLEEALIVKKTGVVTERMRRSVKYKVGRFVLRVQMAGGDTLELIDRASDDIISFISNFAKAEEKDTFVDGVLYLPELEERN